MGVKVYGLGLRVSIPLKESPKARDTFFGGPDNQDPTISTTI